MPYPDPTDRERPGNYGDAPDDDPWVGPSTRAFCEREGIIPLSWRGHALSSGLLPLAEKIRAMDPSTAKAALVCILMAADARQDETLSGEVVRQIRTHAEEGPRVLAALREMEREATA